MFLLCVAGLPLSTIHAQKKEIIDDEAPNGIVIVTIDKAGDEIIRIMNESQLPYIHDPKAPPLPIDGQTRQIRPGYRRVCPCHRRV